MPKEFDACVRGLMKDPEFKPRKENETKKDAAYAVCVAAYKKRHGGKSPFSEAENLSFQELLKVDPDLRLAYLLLEADPNLEEN